MRKCKKAILSLAAICLVFACSIFGMKVKVMAAGTISNATVDGGDRQLTVSGTVPAGQPSPAGLAVAIFVYDETGTTLVGYQTTSITSNSFSTTFSIGAGKYLVKVADYEGGTYVEAGVATVIAPSAQPSTENQNNSTSTIQSSTTTETQKVAPVEETVASAAETVAPVQTVSPKTNDGMEAVLFAAIFVAIALAGYTVRKRA